MGREIKRVPLDFNWPLHKVWEGFLMPKELHLPKCDECDGDGYSAEARAIAQTFYAHQIGFGPEAEALAWHNKIGQAEVDHLVAEGRLRVLRKREPTADNPRDWEWVSEPRTAAEINAENTRGGMHGHDAINRMLLVAFRCDRLGIKADCAQCAGQGDIGTDEQRKAIEDWKGAEPPSGDGWQIWETVSEGSPVSPVFPTRDALIEALVKDGHSRKAAENFAESKWAPSMVMSSAGLKSDIDSCEDMSR